MVISTHTARLFFGRNLIRQQLGITRKVRFNFLFPGAVLLGTAIYGLCGSGYNLLSIYVHLGFALLGLVLILIAVLRQEPKLLQDVELSIREIMKNSNELLIENDNGFILILKEGEYGGVHNGAFRIEEGEKVENKTVVRFKKGLLRKMTPIMHIGKDNPYLIKAKSD